jgi:hypothetical protein
MQKSHIIFEFYLFIELNVIVHNRINIVYLYNDKILPEFLMKIYIIAINQIPVHENRY